MQDEALTWIWKSLIWARGVVAAITIVAIADSFFDWDTERFLSFVHAIIWHWNLFLKLLISPLYELIPSLQFVSDEYYNAAVLMGVSAPIVFFEFLRFSRGAAIYVAGLMTVLPFLIVYLGLTTYHLREFFSEIEPDDVTRMGLLFFQYIPLLFAVMSLAMFLTGAWKIATGKDEPGLRSYFVGLSSGAICLATLELLYFVPTIQKSADDFVERASGLD